MNHDIWKWSLEKRWETFKLLASMRLFWYQVTETDRTRILPQTPKTYLSSLHSAKAAMQSNAMLWKRHQIKHILNCLLHYFRRLLRLDFKEDSCGRLGLGLVACDRCAEVSSERQNHSYLCCIHYADINEIKIEIWISNQTLCWIPLKITKIHFLSLKLSALLLSKADGGGHYYFLSQ